jgi:metal-responsive CopG/Arc/MetJ family transcriptional regulator
MRIHVHLDDGLVAELDERVGARGRSRFIERATRAALDDQRRWEAIRSAIGVVDDHGHEWDADPAAWVHEERGRDATRVG